MNKRTLPRVLVQTLTIGALVAPLAAQTTVEASYFDLGVNAIAATPDGGKIVAGNIAANTLLPGAINAHAGGTDAYVMRFDQNGDVSWSVYFGGGGDDGCWDLELDPNGWCWIAGGTDSTNLPVTAMAYDATYNGGGDAFVAGFDPTGQLGYASYFGGPAGDRGQGIGIDSAGMIYLGGQTNDPGATFPTTPGAFSDTNVSILSTYSDVFVAKIDPFVAGSAALLYSTLIGSGDGDGLEGFDVDAAGNVYLLSSPLTARTREPYWPTTSNAWRPKTKVVGFNLLEASVMSVFAPLGGGLDDLVYSTFLFPEPGLRTALDITADDHGRAYVCGMCWDDLETTPGAFDPDPNAGAINYSDAFAIVLDTRLDGDDSLVYSTYLGGTFQERALSIAVTGATAGSPGKIHLAGDALWDTSPDPVLPFPTTAGALPGFPSGPVDAFYARLNPAGNGPADLEFSTLFGGSGGDSAFHVAIGPTGIAHLAGTTDSTDFYGATGTPTPNWLAALTITQQPTPPAAPSDLTAQGVTTSQIDLTWIDNATNEDGFRIERSADGASWAPLITLVGADRTSWSDEGLSPSETWHYRVQAYAGDLDSAWSNTANATTLSGGGGGGEDAFADGESTTKGTVTGSYADTHADDGVVEAITEGESGGKPSNRSSMLEHVWTFQALGGTKFGVHAWCTDVGDGDDFLFEWSTDGSSYAPLVTLLGGGTVDTEVTFSTVPVTGTVYVRVVDTNRDPGTRGDKDTLSVDFLVIRP